MPKHYLWIHSKSDTEVVCKEKEKHIWFKTIDCELCARNEGQFIWKAVYYVSCERYWLAVVWPRILAKRLQVDEIGFSCSDFPFFRL